MSDAAPGPPTFREKLAWCLFDFANSSFTTVVTTVVFARYFLSDIVPGERYLGLHEQSWWAGGAALANLLVIVTAPLVGAMADQAARKKRYLFRSYVGCVVATAALSFLGPGAVIPALLLVLAGNIAFYSGENLIAGFLPELATPATMGRLSAAGWTLGYFGGLASLGLAYTIYKMGDVRWSFAATALFFGLAGLPTFLWLRERARPIPLHEREGLFQAGFGRMLATWRERARWRDLFTFLTAVLAFQGGLAVVVSLAGIFAEQEIKIAGDDVILLFIVLQLAAAAGAWAFGVVQDRLGSKAALAGSLAVWIAAVLCVWASRGAPFFVFASVLAGIAMGSSQSASRAVVGLFCPSGREAEWFGLWGVATKGANVVGLLLYSVLVNLVSPRTAILAATLPLFLLGLVILTRVDVARGVAAAGSAGVSGSAR